MALYAVIEKKTRKIKKQYAVIEGKTRKIKKQYAVVNGKTKLIYTASIPAGQAVLNVSQTWTVPEGVKTVDIFCVGGGGASGNCSHYEQNYASGAYYYNTLHGSGGAGGYTNTIKNVSVTPGEQLLVTIGAGGVRGGEDYYRYKDPDVSDTYGSAAGMKNGGAGGTTSVARSGVTLCSAAGGNGGNSGGSSTSNSASPGYRKGVNGGSGSGTAGGNCYYYTGSKTSNDKSSSDGSNGTNGGNGGASNYYNAVSDTTNTYDYGGKGQGTTTRAFGESTGTVYSPAGNNGVPGGGGRTATYPSYINGNKWGSQDGAAGLVIIRWAEQEAV